MADAKDDKVPEGRKKDGRFTYGNLFSIGLENSGRPPLYVNPEALAKKIAEYLDWCDANKRPDSYSGQGKGIYTLAGCALYLGFATRQSMYDYEKKSAEFSYVINRFRTFLVNWNEEKLYWGGTFQGSSFWLRNWGGYSDESTVNNNVQLTEVKPRVITDGTPPLAYSETDKPKEDES